MADPQNIDEALLALQADPPVLVKDKKGQVGNQKTKYADLVQVNAVVLSRLNALGVVWKCRPDVLLPDYRFVLRYELRHVASGTAEAGTYPVKGENPMQQGSAITYARRYALLAVTGIAAEDEDDDGQAADGQRTAQRSTQYRQRQAEPTGQATAQRAPARSRPATPSTPPPLPGEPAGGGISEPQRRKLYALLREAGIGERHEALAYIADVLGKDIASTTELTVAEAAQVIDRLERFIAQSEPPADLDGGQ